MTKSDYITLFLFSSKRSRQKFQRIKQNFEDPFYNKFYSLPNQTENRLQNFNIRLFSFLDFSFFVVYNRVNSSWEVDMVSDTGGPDFVVEHDFSKLFENIDKSTLFIGIIIGIFLGIIIHIFYLWFKRIYNKTIQDFPGENNNENDKE